METWSIKISTTWVNTWSGISTVINNKKSITKCSKFTHNNRYITNDNELANHFNKYFVNIGPNPVKNIPYSSSTFQEQLQANTFATIIL